MMKRFGGLWPLVVLGAAWVSVSAVASDTPQQVDGRVAAHLGSLRSGFDPRVVATLDRIDGLDRRLLAARSYLRARSSLAERWSWSQQEIDHYEGSPLQRALDDEIARVRAVFEAENPGYTLWVNPKVRSVELQVERWNQNTSVAAAAESVLDAARRQVSDASAPPVGTPAAREWFARLLLDIVPQPAPTLAAPGLSRHGRMQAVDFHVKQGDRTVAAPRQEDVVRAWEAQGWCERLVRAVRFGSTHFAGPLVKPNEPWHYEYGPAVATAATTTE